MGFTETVRREGRVYDLVALVAPLAVLGVVFALPRETRLAYALVYLQPTVTTAYTMHFVHFEFEHLATNLLGYGLLVPTLYLVSLRARRRYWFYVALVSVFVAYPLALSGLNLLFARPRVGFGFSGLNMAFLGTLPVLLAALGREVTGSVDHDDAPILFFLGTGLVGTLAAMQEPRALTVGVTLGTTGAAVAYGYRLVRRTDGVRDALVGFAQRPGDFELVVVGVAVFFGVLLAGFPLDPASEGRVLNVYLHFLGYALGFIVPYTTFAVLRHCGVDWRGRRRTTRRSLETDGGPRRNAPRRR